MEHYKEAYKELRKFNKKFNENVVSIDYAKWLVEQKEKEMKGNEN